MKEMLSATDMNASLIESDNCSRQYKSAEHFYDLQKIADKEQKTLIRFYVDAKGEVDHFWGIAKVSARDEISRGIICANAAQIVSHLIKKFGTNENPAYHIKGSYPVNWKMRGLRHKKVFKTIDGSASFHVLVFKPGQTYLSASPRICICDQCLREYGSCQLFSRYKLNVNELRSEDPPSSDTIGAENVNGFVTPQSYGNCCSPYIT